MVQQQQPTASDMLEHICGVISGASTAGGGGGGSGSADVVGATTTTPAEGGGEGRTRAALNVLASATAWYIFDCYLQYVWH